GGSGNDIYVYSLGDGHDIINNYDANIDSQDILNFGPNINQENVQLSRNNDDLLLIVDEDNSITIQSYFSQDAKAKGYQLDSIIFADGTMLDVDNIDSLIELRTEFDNIIYGTEGDDTISGDSDSDSDKISGGNGDDSITVGENDFGSGGEGNDH
ncbi:calcium-binding protein, partial [Psychrobacter sp. AOP7-C1-12]|uniref:calcium-binding protein n=1 Tax=Psychrobacter sp. AOP7-C1-12 TaxID=3457641 RepID=UPI00402B9535